MNWNASAPSFRAFAAWIIAALLLSASLLRIETARGEDPHAECLACHGDRALKPRGKRGAEISLFVDAEAFGRSVHAANACVSCHTDAAEIPHADGFIAKPVACASCHARAMRSGEAGAHTRARMAGKTNAPNCAGCHGVHDIAKANALGSRLDPAKQTQTCGPCHPKIAAQMRESVHGRALASGAREAPACTDCHTEHAAPRKGVSPSATSGETCRRCHASERMNTRFNLPSDRVTTFHESYHGLAGRFGSTRAANCASCHGVHDVFPSSDPRSSVHPANLVNTCGRCHPGATTRFTEGKIHVPHGGGEGLGGTINRGVRRFYLALISGIIGFMLLHNALVWRRKAMKSLRAPDRVVLRMDLAQRIQHFLLASCFVYLALTGFALKYPESWVAWLGGPSEEFRRMGHRIAGVLLLALGVGHLIYLAVAREGRRLLRDLLPTRADARDLAAAARDLMGRRSEKPRFGRFGYPEKIEYWAVLWGTAIMGVTGLVIWFKMDVTRGLPRWVIDVATTIHFYEAVLAVLAIFVWHLYHVMLDPDVSPMNWAWLDGRVSESWLRETHPGDTAARRIAPKEKAKPDGASAKSA